MLGSDLVAKAEFVDEMLNQFGHIYQPGFWCREYNWKYDPVCIKCPKHLSCHEKFMIRMQGDELDTGKFDWGLMVLTGEVTPDFFTNIRGIYPRVNGVEDGSV